MSVYREEINEKLSDDLQLKIRELPTFCKGFFTSIDSSVSKRTQFSYATDLRVFFKWLITKNPMYKGMSVRELPFDTIRRLTRIDIDEFMVWLGGYKDNGSFYSNNTTAKKRKLSTLRSFFHYLEEERFIEHNPTNLVKEPKLDKKVPLVMTDSETSDFLSVIEYGTGLTKKELAYHEKTKVRDMAIFTILLNTGIRISELVGLDIQDFDFDRGEFRVIRKGGKEEIIPYNDAVEEALLYYLDYDRGNFTTDDNEPALFLSLQRKRITVKAVENLCVKYASIAVPLKHITPHKLRSTFGTKIYNDTGDIYLTADLLGHSSVDTTKRYYASINVDRKRDAVRNFSYK